MTDLIPSSNIQIKITENREMAEGKEDPFRRTDEEAARRGHPSYVWRAGQDRRLALVRQWARLDGARILDDGCGVGMYTAKFRQFSPHVVGVEIDPAAATQARARPEAQITVGRGEALPFAEHSFDVIFSHEVIEHVDDDRQAAAEMVRVLAPSGRIVLFCPNRLYPFETHGHFWRGKYHFGNTPLINWLPNPLRNRLAPHVRAYTGPGLRDLFAGQPVRVIHHQVIYPGFDNIVATRPQIGRLLKRALYAVEHTPLQVFGLSHFLVLEREG